MKGKSPTRGKDLGCTVCSGPDTSGQEFPRLASHSNLHAHNGQAGKVPIAGTPDSGLKDAAGENPSGPVAQWLEPTAHNGLVAGSSPAGPTTLRPDGATRGAAMRSNIDLGEAVSGMARRAATDWMRICGTVTVSKASIILITRNIKAPTQHRKRNTIMADRLKGKVALISGGATGMGGASSKLFAAEGAKVAIVDVNMEAAQATAAEITRAGGVAIALKADVSKADEVNAAVAAAHKAFGPINVLFNHAGTIVIKPFLETTEEEWDWLHDVNVKSMFLMTKAVIPHMLAAGGGSIVCTSSISAVLATPNEVLYDTTKGAVHMFARAIAVEFRDRNIRCNAVCPGFIQTPHGNREVKELAALGVDVSDAAIAAQQGRMGYPEDVARAALYLASDDAEFVTGQQLFVDNGFSAI